MTNSSGFHPSILQPASADLSRWTLEELRREVTSLRYPTSFEDIALLLRLHRAVLTRIQTKQGQTKVLTLPNEIVDTILLLDCGTNPTRRFELQSVCLTWRSMIMLNSAFWSEVASLPTPSALFYPTFLRASTQRKAFSLTLDTDTFCSRLPNANLLTMTLSRCRSVIINHHVDITDVVRQLCNIGSLPLLETLEVAALGGVHVSELTGRNTLRVLYAGNQPTLLAPRLKTLRIQQAYFHLPDVVLLGDFRVDCKTPLHPFGAFNGWEPDLLLSTIARQSTLRILHLCEPIGQDSLGTSWGKINLPYLEELVILSQRARIAAWVIDHIDVPSSTYIRVGVCAVNESDAFPCEVVCASLGVHYARRMLPALNLYQRRGEAGILLSPEVRVFERSSNRLINHVAFHTHDPHGQYVHQAGAIDVAFMWTVQGGSGIRWSDYLVLVLKTRFMYCRITTLEFVAEYYSNGWSSQQRDLVRRLKHLQELRLRSESYVPVETIAQSMVGNIGDSRRVFARKFKAVFPLVTTIVDLEGGSRVFRGNAMTLAVRMHDAARFEFSSDDSDEG